MAGARVYSNLPFAQPLDEQVAVVEDDEIVLARGAGRVGGQLAGLGPVDDGRRVGARVALDGERAGLDAHGQVAHEPRECGLGDEEEVGAGLHAAELVAGQAGVLARVLAAHPRQYQRVVADLGP